MTCSCAKTNIRKGRKINLCGKLFSFPQVRYSTAPTTAFRLYVLSFLLSGLAFFLLLSILILIHEWGHFYAARKTGVVVEEFGFGLPPRAKTLFKQGGTQFSLNWIPFGGFVRLKGEAAVEDDVRKEKGSFAAASIPARIIILCGGVFMNFLLAVFILTIGFSFWNWIPTFTSIESMEAAAERGVIDLTLGVRIEQVISGGAAAKVGVPEGSILAAIDGQTVVYPGDVSVLQEGKKRVVYTLLTGDALNEEQEFRITLDEGKSGVAISAFPLELNAPNRSIFTGFALSIRESWVMTKQTAIGMGKLFVSLASTGRVPEGITGIVGIAQLTHASVQESFMTYLRLIALLSLSLAALNILPFPALDGGRLIFVLAEAISRRPVNRTFELATNGIGFLLLIALILLITYHDIVRIFF